MQTKQKNNVVDTSTGRTAQEDFARYMQEIKGALKSKSKNELIRTVGALLLDNYALKETIANMMPKAPSQDIAALTEEEKELCSNE